MTEAPDPFSQPVIAAVCAHMNGDHNEDSRLIARSLGGRPDAESAEMVDLRPDGAVFSVTSDGAHEQVVVPWAIEITQRGDFRVEVVRMYQEACAALGVEARQAGEH